MFSGVGPLAISAAKKVKYVYANDINPMAVEYLERNMVLNKLERKIEVSTLIYGREHTIYFFFIYIYPVASCLRCTLLTKVKYWWLIINSGTVAGKKTFG